MAGNPKVYVLRARAILALQCAGIGPDIHDALSEAKESLEHACRLMDERQDVAEQIRELCDQSGKSVCVDDLRAIIGE